MQVHGETQQINGHCKGRQTDPLEEQYGMYHKKNIFKELTLHLYDIPTTGNLNIVYVSIDR